MPFTPQVDLPPDPDVRVFFTGLMLIRPSVNRMTAEIWVHRAAAEHEVTIEVRQKQTGYPDLIKMRQVGPLPFALPTINLPGGEPIHGLILQVQNAPKGVRAYAPVMPNDKALSEAVNFQSSRYHNGRVAPDRVFGDDGGIDRLNGRPSILMNDGLFYSAAKVSGATILLERDGAPTVNLASIVNIIGANIYLDPADVLMVRWGAQGALKQLELKKPATGSGISYEIYVINDPLFEGFTPAPSHNEFEEYYKLLREIPSAGMPPAAFRPQDQFRLKITPPGGNPDRGSTDIPCMPGLVDP